MIVNTIMCLFYDDFAKNPETHRTPVTPPAISNYNANGWILYYQSWKNLKIDLTWVLVHFRVIFRKVLII